jgi:hypothetical protein
MATNESAVLIAIGCVAFFVLIWCLALWAISWASGWRRLVERFGATFEFNGEVTTYASAQIGLANYNGGLIVGASSDGIYLVPVRIFRPFHRPLLIPWAEIVARSYGSAAFPRVQLTFPSVPGKRILLYRRSAKQCMPYLCTGSDNRSG